MMSEETTDVGEMFTVLLMNSACVEHNEWPKLTGRQQKR